ncbi:hypothetical protein [Pseudomonas plecoglossicida]|uniref:hypothetical protein n=1 Tax=Pseudomonas plecoglossicida TaxID=70775 RepID=UPI003D19CB76
MDADVLLVFLVPVLALFCAGFIMGARGEFRSVQPVAQRCYALQRISIFLKIMVSLTSVASVMQWYSFVSSGGGLSFDSIGESYVSGYEGYERGQASIDAVYILNIFQQALILITLLFGFYYYKVMGRFGRLLFVFIVVTYLLVNVLGAGKQKYLGDLVIFSVFCSAINLAAKGTRFRAASIFLAMGLAFFVFFLFVEILRQRYQAAGINIDNIYNKAHALITWDRDAWIFNVVNADYALALGIFFGYFTNGLYGLYLSLTLPFEWSYFVGNSYSLGRIVEILLGANGAVLEHTYPYRVGEVYGWEFDKWHSMFAWLASDLTFPGVVLLTPIFAFFYARIWIQAIRASNPFAGPLFIYFSMGLVFSYANNQLMHSLSGVMVLFVLLVGWVMSGTRTRLLDGPGSEDGSGLS